MAPAPRGDPVTQARTSSEVGSDRIVDAEMAPALLAPILPSLARIRLDLGEPS